MVRTRTWEEMLWKAVFLLWHGHCNHKHLWACTHIYHTHTQDTHTHRNGSSWKEPHLILSLWTFCKAETVRSYRSRAKTIFLGLSSAPVVVMPVLLSYLVFLRLTGNVFLGCNSRPLQLTCPKANAVVTEHLRPVMDFSTYFSHYMVFPPVHLKSVLTCDILCSGIKTSECWHIRTWNLGKPGFVFPGHETHICLQHKLPHISPEVRAVLLHWHTHWYKHTHIYTYMYTQRHCPNELNDIIKGHALFSVT